MRHLCARTLFAALLLYGQANEEAQNRFFAEMDAALQLRPGAVVADIGTGPAVLHPLRFAEKVGPTGRVVCVDVKPSVINQIKTQIAEHHLANMEAVLGKEDDPLLPASTFDAILVSNTYHEFARPEAMLKCLRDALKPDGALVVAEIYSEAHQADPRAEQAKRHDLSPDILERELSAAGFVITERSRPTPLSRERQRYFVRAAKSKS